MKYTVRVLGPEAGDALRSTKPGTAFSVCVASSGVALDKFPVVGDSIEIRLRSGLTVVARIVKSRRVPVLPFVNIQAVILAPGDDRYEQGALSYK